MTQSSSILWGEVGRAEGQQVRGGAPDCSAHCLILLFYPLSALTCLHSFALSLLG